MIHEPGPIASARADLAAILREATDIPVVTSLTTDDTTYNAVTVRMSLTVAVAPTTNALAIERLDEAVDTIAVALIKAGTAAAIDAYTSIKSAEGQAYLAAPITTTLTYSLGRTPQ